MIIFCQVLAMAFLSWQMPNWVGDNLKTVGMVYAILHVAFLVIQFYHFLNRQFQSLSFLRCVCLLAAMVPLELARAAVKDVQSHPTQARNILTNPRRLEGVQITENE